MLRTIAMAGIAPTCRSRSRANLHRNSFLDYSAQANRVLAPVRLQVGNRSRQRACRVAYATL